MKVDEELSSKITEIKAKNNSVKSQLAVMR